MAAIVVAAVVVDVVYQFAVVTVGPFPFVVVVVEQYLRFVAEQ